MNRLKELRKENHYTLDDIEKLTGIKRGTYSNYENGNTEPKLETWQKLSDFFEVSIAYLQGLTISEDEVIKLLNDTYISDIETLKTFKKLQNNVSTIQEEAPIIQISHSVDMYLIINKIPLPLDVFSISQLKKYPKEVKNYWTKNFNFIFNDNVDVNINIYSSLSKMSSSEKNSLIEEINFCISVKYLSASNTPISECFEESNSYHDMAIFQKKSEDLTRFGSKEEIKSHITRIISDLNSFLSKLNDLPDNPSIKADIKK
ncbi:helix-turn-helix domain-containing protein [Lactobacillus intestinalis]|uniref:helix-turn-helix domain-containing protein n=1 Tax=Lactobacillus intestinalis TaxID=151781 RepID=UPI0025AA117A|nr:helix-turn-helix transcriptional regulator [Lactobacillus intestinalis]